MWTNENRARYDRSGLRYPSDMTDAEWELIAPLIPPARRSGGKRKVRAGPGCLNSASRKLSGFLPGYSERGASRF